LAGAYDPCLEVKVGARVIASGQWMTTATPDGEAPVVRHGWPGLVGFGGGDTPVR
jgi:hypothetical protein